MAMNADILSSLQYKNLLLDFYGDLLTDKQKHIYAMSVAEDCSFAEIGNAYDITPQAVADSIKRANRQLEKFEETLGLVAISITQQQAVADIESALADLDSQDCASRIRNIVEKLLL